MDYHPYSDPEDFTRVTFDATTTVLLPWQMGFEWKKNSPRGPYKLVNLVLFGSENTVIRKFRTPEGSIIVNYFMQPTRRTQARDITRFFTTPNDAKLFLENSLRRHMEAAFAENLPTLQDFLSGKCFLFPGTDSETYYIVLRGQGNAQQVSVQLSHIAVYAYLGDWLYRVDENGDRVHFPQVSPSQIDLSHRCHNKTCFNPYHLLFELQDVNVGRCPSTANECTCDTDPQCLFGQEVNTYNFFSLGPTIPNSGRAYVRRIEGGYQLLPVNEITGGAIMNGVPDSQYYVEINTNL